MRGRFVVVTGANTGIGRVTAEVLAARGARVVLACRSESRTAPVLDAIRRAGGEASFVALDLADFASVRAAAAAILAMNTPIDVLIDNAGLAAPGRTKDGFELTFGTNHLGHFLFTMLLFPRLTEDGRVVVVSSGSHYQAKGIDFEAVQRKTASITAVPEYEVSKLANVLFVKELARRLGTSGVTAYALHPGVVASDAWRRIPWPVRAIAKLFMISNEEGAKTTLYCATAPELAGESGHYYDGSRRKAPSALAEDATLARELWERSVAWTGADLPG